MHFREFAEPGWRVYAGALESPRGDGYTAAVVVRREADAVGAAARDVYRDELLAGGHRWASADEALGYALRRGRAQIRREPAALAAD